MTGRVKRMELITRFHELRRSHYRRVELFSISIIEKAKCSSQAIEFVIWIRSKLSGMLALKENELAFTWCQVIPYLFTESNQPNQ